MFLCTSHIDTHRERERQTECGVVISMSPGRMSLYVVHPVDREGGEVREGGREREGGEGGGEMCSE